MVVVFGNVTNHTTPWVPEPNGRGTWTLLSSCVITIALCAWTALHLNVPEHGTADRQWLRKTKWFVLGLAAPEMVVYAAWRQRQEAKRLLRDVRSHLRQAAPPSRFRRVLDFCFRFWKKDQQISIKVTSTASSPTSMSASSQILQSEWTLVHAFYAVMGGFAMDSSSASEAFLPDSRSRAALTAEGLRFLLEHEPDLLPDITKAQIQDKSKADGLKKFLICVQASWFCASCITRLANALPISLLELNAMGHAACALCIYAMWWEKPLDVDEPTLVHGYKALPLLAYMWMGSRISAKGMKSHDLHGWLRDEFDAFWMYEDPKVDDLVLANRPAPRDANGRTLPPSAGLEKGGLDPIAFPLGFRHYSTASAFALRFRIISWLRSKEKLVSLLRVRFAAGLGVRKTAIDHVSPVNITRWKLAHEAVQKYRLEEDVCSRHRDRSDVYDENSRVKVRIGNLQNLIGSRAWEVWFGFAVAGVVYGGLHMLAWNAPFSSRLEQILWRVAASSVTIAPLLLSPFALIFSRRRLGRADPELTKKTQGEVVQLNGGLALFWFRRATMVILMPVLAVGPFLWISYVLGRVYLVVECFKNVAHLPEAVFEDVSWPAYLPHIN